jgi:hypothetical protein
MTPEDYSNHFHAALAKAFAADAPSVRIAWFELADFYQRQLDRAIQMQPSTSTLSACLTAHRMAREDQPQAA